ncbi:MAG: helix-turn-helix transcriptional regulator [Sphaerospermopsis sp. SIO1G1]|nr:helix-turn-helix transcriptional regulator [Sphaerospermopsis sp. SIO1G1]
MKAIAKIRQLREEVGITQLELSQLVGVTETSIQNWERGRAGIEQIERVIKLCQALDCQPEDLIEYQKVSEEEIAQAQPKGRERLKKMRQLLGTDKLDHDSAVENKPDSHMEVK